jgi:hypothetical protein
MLVILQTWCQIQRTTTSLRYVNCGHGHIQCNYSYVYSGFNIQLNVSALLFVISRQRNARCTANMVPNTAHILQFTLCGLWSRTYTMYLQLRIFRPQYSTERICADIGEISIIKWALYCNLSAKYSAPHPLYSMWPVVPDIYNVFAAPHIQATIFNWTYQRCNWRYSDTSIRVILQIWCQIQLKSSNLRCVNCGPGHIQCNYSSAYSGLNIQLNVSALLLEISRQRNARYTANMVPNIEQILQFTLSELWSRTYTM